MFVPAVDTAAFGHHNSDFLSKTRLTPFDREIRKTFMRKNLRILIAGLMFQICAVAPMLYAQVSAPPQAAPQATTKAADTSAKSAAEEIGSLRNARVAFPMTA